MPIDFSAADRHIRFCIERDRLSGVSVCAVGPEGVAFSQGYGFRDAAHAVRPDADTVFGVASMSKSITALALAILENCLLYTSSIWKATCPAAFSGCLPSSRACWAMRPMWTFRPCARRSRMRENKFL